MRTRLKVYRCKDDKDISDFIETRNGKSNPFGWSQHELWYKNSDEDEVQVGWLECGAPDAFEGFRMEVIEDKEG